MGDVFGQLASFQWKEPLLLNVLLVILATATTIVALTGETRHKDTKRLTTRGWVTLVCVVFGFLVGIRKEIITQSNNANQQAENEQLKGGMKELRSSLQGANNTLLDTRSKLIQAQLASQKTSEAIQLYVFERLSLSTRRFLGILSYMIEDASDGWLPTKENEFFSRRTVDLICRELNADGPARVSPPMSWFAYFSRAIGEYKAILGDVVRAHGPQLDLKLIREISKVEGAAMFWMVPQLAAARNVDKDLRRYPPVLCPMQTDEIVRDFDALAELYRHVTNDAVKFKVRPLELPLPRKSPALGKNRFTPKQLKKWEIEHNVRIQ